MDLHDSAVDVLGPKASEDPIMTGVYTDSEHHPALHGIHGPPLQLTHHEPTIPSSQSFLSDPVPSTERTPIIVYSRSCCLCPSLGDGRQCGR